MNAPVIGLSAGARLKFDLLSCGLGITTAAQRYIDTYNNGRPMTPADYASTSGVILELDGEVWVNAPIGLHNPNFVKSPDYSLVLLDDRLAVQGRGHTVPARFWLPPDYHGTINPEGEPYNSYAFTHGDRVRISPIEGCAMACQFCDLPFEFRYRRKRVAGLVEAVARAASDAIQPAAHILISGGTPHPEDYEYVQATYEAVIRGFPHLPVDIMMVPAEGLLDVEWLHSIGVNQLSINIEIFDEQRANKIMKRKASQGLEYYLSFIEHGAEVLGTHRVRSMLLVGIEPLESTLAGVDAIVRRGGVPVLSPFRPDPSTPLRAEPPPTADTMREAYLRARDVAAAAGGQLGPRCLPCSHNTLTLAGHGHGEADQSYGYPRLI